MGDRSRALAERPVAIAVMLFCALDGAVYGASAVLFVPLSIRLGTGPDGYAYLLAGGSLGGVIGPAWRVGSARRPGWRRS